MKKTTRLLSILLLFAGYCSGLSAQEDKNIVQLKVLSDEVKQNHAPDRRSRTWETTFMADSLHKGIYVVKGVTTEPQAKEALAAAAAHAGITLVDSIKLLPDAALGAKIYGITNLSATVIRYAPNHSGEMATQTIMGMPLRILEKRGSWWRMITPEGYIGWINSAVQAMTKEEYDDWTKADKIVVTTHFTLFREQPSAAAAVVRDGIWGNIVRYIGEKGGYYKVMLPDGKQAFVPKTEAQKFTKWINSRNPDATNIITTAKQFVGFPYLWGGTAAKAMDCSGFVKTCFYINGVIVPRDASQQARAGEEVDLKTGLEHLQPADLLFFGSSPERITHVGLYLGDGKFIHANASWASVTIESLNPDAPDYTSTARSLVRAKRYINVIDKDKDIVSIKNHPWY